MNAKQIQPRSPMQHLQYVRGPSGEYVLYSTKYTPKDGKAVGPKFQADFGSSVGLHDMQVCLLNLKLRVDGLTGETHSTHYRVMEGDQAGFFGQTLAQIRKTSDLQWYSALYGDMDPFFGMLRGATPRTVAVPKTHPDMPLSITVELFDGVASGTNRTSPVVTKEGIEEIIVSLQRQVQAKRAIRRTSDAGAVVGENADTSFIRSSRPAQAWAALEQLLRVFADPSNKFNRLYATDRLEESVWRDSRTFAYLGLQAREYMKANYRTQENRWHFTFSKSLKAAIDRSLVNAITYLPYRGQQSHSLTAFDDWDHRHEIVVGVPQFEIARVLIWPTSRLLKEDDFAVLRFHQIFNIPLFFLEPSFLENEPADEYILFCKKGQNADTDARDLIGLAWDARRHDKSFQELKTPPLAHFLKLLEHPKLLFAVDAREILREGKWAAFVNGNSEGVD